MLKSHSNVDKTQRTPVTFSYYVLTKSDCHLGHGVDKIGRHRSIEALKEKAFTKFGYDTGFLVFGFRHRYVYILCHLRHTFGAYRRALQSQDIVVTFEIGFIRGKSLHEKKRRTRCRWPRRATDF